MQPLNPYASAKRRGEMQRRHTLDNAGVDYVILRPFSVYDPPQA